MAIYELIEWDGKGSGDNGTPFKTKKSAMAERECTRTRKEAQKAEGENYFYKGDVKCSNITKYSSKKAFEARKESQTWTWY